MIFSKAFRKESKDDGTRPLSECYSWARAHCLQRDDRGTEHLMPMLVHVRQCGDSRPYTPILREYVACELEAFYTYYRECGNDTERHCDEVIGLGPCKAYCDFELEFDDAKMRRHGYSGVAEMLQKHGCAKVDDMRALLEASSDKMIAEIVKFHKEAAGVDVQPFITLAHKASKWSKHVVFVNSVWRNATHFGSFMKRLMRTTRLVDPLVTLYVDTQVYGRFRCMRMYRSSKLKEPQRSLLQVNEAPASKIDPLTLLNSLITVIPLPPGRADEEDDDDSPDVPMPPPAPQQTIYVTTAYLDRYPDMIRQCGLRPIEDVEARGLEFVCGTDADGETHNEFSPLTDEFRAIVQSHFMVMDPDRCKWNEFDCLVRIDCRALDCAILRGRHDTPRTYLEIDMHRRMYRQCCHSVHCQRRPTPWMPVESALADYCRDFTQRWRCNQTLPEAVKMMCPGK